MPTLARTITDSAYRLDHAVSIAGRILFSLGLLGLGIEHFIFGDFVTGRAPSWPEGLPGQLFWAYVTGAAFVGISLMLLARKWERPAALVGVGLILFWALLRHIPVLVADPFLSGAWTEAGKAWTLIGGLLVALAGSQEKREISGSGGFLRDRPRPVAAGRALLGLFFVVTGIQHFIYTAFVASLIPSWFPGHATVWTYLAGGMLLAAGIGLFLPGTARAAALLSGLMVFCWIWIVHLPRVFVTASDGISIFEAPAVAGIAWMIASLHRGRMHAASTRNDKQV